MEKRFFINMAYPAAVIFAFLYAIIIAIGSLTGMINLESVYVIVGFFLLYPILW